MESPGRKFRKLVAENYPLQIGGAVNANAAIIAKKAGFKSIYLSGGGVAACSLGLPDLGISTLSDVLIDAGRITSVCDLPLLVDVDVGWGGSFNIARCTKEMVRTGVAAIHIEDQVLQKRCGHRPNKALVDVEDMCGRIKSAVDARQDQDFVVMARTDALANEGLQAAIDRAGQYIEAGADMLFPEAVNSLEEYAAFKSALNIPILANITEFGQTPLFTTQELASVGVDMALYPLSAFRAMCKAAIKVYEAILDNGTQAGVVDTMQTRAELYNIIDYQDYEIKLDQLLQSSKKYE